MQHICTTCDGLGQERRKITHPAANVSGWTREARPLLSDWWRRRCEPCKGTGYVETNKSSVPSVGKWK